LAIPPCPAAQPLAGRNSGGNPVQRSDTGRDAASLKLTSDAGRPGWYKITVTAQFC